MKNNLFKESKDCEEKADGYICEVFVIPFGKLTKNACSNQNYDDDLLEEIYEESFCKANENCDDLSRCSMYNFDCEYDSDVLPFIGESSSVFDENECPHEDLVEKIKRFFENNWEDMVISGVINALFLMITIIMLLCCCRPKPRVVQDINMV